ncbi:unnamed protein product [Dicrocoelium dendriticum]|nr:unnamed protein product [Dicrocoelium dendriticum]
MDLPWIEKYRPCALDEVISQLDISKTLSKFIEQGRLPHLLFYGPPGTGKTSTILATAKTLYPAKELNSMVMELNASDARGINVVREQILSFASTKMLFAGKFKLVILDEADSMTKDAQNALRRIIEKYTENTRFCLICNYISKIIPAVQSRCTKFRFAPIGFSQMSPRLHQIAANENVLLTDNGVKAIHRFAAGDMRKAINLMQLTCPTSCGATSSSPWPKLNIACQSEHRNISSLEHSLPHFRRPNPGWNLCVLSFDNCLYPTCYFYTT